jgi:lipopolysaccharide export LptBFGC system permease protein LptF
LKIPLYFQFIFKKLFILFLIIYTSLLSTFFCLELLTFSSLPSIEKLFYFFLSLALSKADLLLTLSLLLASIQTIQSLRQHGELTALETNGISKARLSLPFFTLSLLLTVFSYWNIEFGVTHATDWKIKSVHSKRNTKSTPLESRHLPDQTRVIYQQNNTQIFDLYWILSSKEILHCKTLSFEGDHYVGHFVDRIKQNVLGRFEKSESYLKMDLPFLLNDIKERIVPPQKMPLSNIYSALENKSLMLSFDQAKFITALLYKLIHPWFPLLFITGLLAYLFSAQRKTSYFSFLIGILFYLFFYSMMKTFILLSENYFISPWITIFLFPIGIQGIFTYKLCKN